MTISRRRFLRTTGAALSAPFCIKFLGDKARAALVTPEYLVPFIDSKFGTKVVKVTNPNNPIPGLNIIWGKVATHHYSSDQAWNADQSLLMMGKGTSGKLFIDGTTYVPVMNLKSPGDVRWHQTDPSLMVFLGKAGIGYWNVQKKTTQVVDALSGYTGPNWGDNKGNLSDDGTMLAVAATRSDGKKVVFAYDLVSGTKYPDIDMRNVCRHLFAENEYFYESPPDFHPRWPARAGLARV